MRAREAKPLSNAGGGEIKVLEGVTRMAETPSAPRACASPGPAPQHQGSCWISGIHNFCYGTRSSSLSAGPRANIQIGDFGGVHEVTFPDLHVPQREFGFRVGKKI